MLSANNPIISVCVVAYNHEKFIAECLDSILEQSTEFGFEIVIGEDCSTDNTRKIIHEYINKYGDAIRLVTSDNNVGMHKNFVRAMKACRGEYVAIIESDDYWRDVTKLQKQVDFLKKNPQFVLSHHDAIIVDETGAMLAESKLPDNEKRDYESLTLQRGGWVLTLTMCFRNVLQDFPSEFLQVGNPDFFLAVLLGNYGGAKFQPEINPAGYRKHTQGIWGLKPVHTQWIIKAKTFSLICDYFKRTGKLELKLHFLHLYFNTQLSIAGHYKQVGMNQELRALRRDTLKKLLSIGGIRMSYAGYKKLKKV